MYVYMYVLERRVEFNAGSSKSEYSAKTIKHVSRKNVQFEEFGKFVIFRNSLNTSHIVLA